MFWDVLEIEETKDVKKITQAYRKKLVNTNPEDKPEEFKALRQAYEQALDFARNNTVSNVSPIDAWKEKLASLYHDFSRRIQLKEWQLLLNEDVCLSLDKKLLVEEALLNFFMEFYRIPHVVWVYLNDQFQFLDHLEELYDKYPKDFIDYVVVNGVNYDEVLPFELFTPGINGQEVDHYFNMYFDARNADYEQAKPILLEMEQCEEQHPYGIIQKANFERQNGQDVSIEVYESLYEKYEDDEFIMYSLADAYNQVGEYEKCEELCRKILERDQINRVKWLLANALGNQKRYKEAIENIHDLMNTAGGDQMLLYELNEKRREWNVVLIEQYQKELEENYDNHQNRVDLTWAYLQNDFTEESFELSKTLEKEKMEPFDYYNLMSNIYISKNLNEEAIPFIDELLKVIENMEQDGTEKTAKRIRRYPEMLNRKGYCLLACKREEEGLKVYDEALKISNDDPDILTRVCQIAFSRKQYDKAEEYARRLIAAKPQGYHGYLLLAYVMYDQRYDRDAFEAINESLNLYGGDLEAYILKIRIMIRNGAYDGAREIIEFLDNSGLSEDLQVLFVKGLLIETEEEKEQEALEYYEKCAALIKEAKVFHFGGELYYRMLWIKGQSLNVNVDKDWKEMMNLANKGLEENPSHYGLIDYKAWLLLRKEKYKESLKFYKRLEEEFPNHSADVETQIGYIYYQSLEKDAKLALDYYLKSIEMEDTGNKRFYTGMCYMYLGELEKAEKEFLILQERNPDGLDSYFRLSAIYEAMNRLDEALVNINKSIEIVSKREGNQVRYYKAKSRILRRMGRVDEAAEVIHFMAKQYKYEYARQDLVKMYCQFGKWDDAKREIALWKTLDIDHYNPESEIRMYFVLGDYEAAKRVFEKYKAFLGDHLTCSIEKSIAQIEGNPKQELDVLLRQLEYAQKRKSADLSHIYMNLAQCYFRLHDAQNQKLYAKKALRIINRELKKITLDHALYYGRKAKVLALLGKEKEARENIALARKLPLCDFCAYRSCKDADIYEVNMEEFFGNKDKAVQLAKTYLEKWPDEDDFVCEFEYLKKENA